MCNSGNRVVVAAASSPVHRVAARVFESAGWETGSVRDGLALVDEVLSRGREVGGRAPFAAVLVEARLPRLSGLDAIDFLTHGPCRWTPIILLVNPDDAEAARRGRALGVAAILEEPLREPSLRRVFESLSSASCT